MTNFCPFITMTEWAKQPRGVSERLLQECEAYEHLDELYDALGASIDLWIGHSALGGTHWVWPAFSSFVQTHSINEWLLTFNISPRSHLWFEGYFREPTILASPGTGPRNHNRGIDAEGVKKWLLTLNLSEISTILFVGHFHQPRICKTRGCTVAALGANFTVPLRGGNVTDEQELRAKRSRMYRCLAAVIITLASLSGCVEPRPAFGPPISAGAAPSMHHGAGSNGYKVLFRFDGDDGAHPLASLTYHNLVFYGTTEQGGRYGMGTVFIVTAGGAQQVLYSFKSGAANPHAELQKLNGVFFGTTYFGGQTHGCNGMRGCGAVFKITNAGQESTFYGFKGGSDGAYPEAGLNSLNGVLYGTTSGGTVFRVTTAGNELVLHNFGGYLDGSTPVAGLTNLRGTLYGTTLAGGGSGCGGNGCGTVFSITASGIERVIHSFHGPRGGRDGASPKLLRC